MRRSFVGLKSTDVSVDSRAMRFVDSEPSAPSATNRGERGVTTAEVLIAGLVLTVGLLATAQVVIGGLRAQGTADRRTVAARVVDSEIERIRSLAYENIAIDASDRDAVAGLDGLITVAGTVNSLDPVVEVSIDGTDYDVRRHVLAVPIGSEAEAYRRVVVIAEWTDESGTHQHRVDTGVYSLDAS